MKRLLILLLSAGLFFNAQAQVIECVDPDLIDPFSFCPLIFSPVCGCDGIDYSNSCLAEKQGGNTDWFPTPFVSCSMIATDCLAPARHLVTDVSASDIVFEWDNPIANAAIAFRVQGRVAGTTAWANSPVISAGSASTSFALPTALLSSGTVYEWRVQASCAPLGVNIAPESAISSFTAPAARVASSNSGMAIYPNPAQESLNLSYISTEDAVYAYQIVDMLGQVHLSGTLDLGAGIQQVQLDISSLGVGMFSLVMENDQTELVERFYHEN